MNFKKIKAKLPPKELVELRKRLQSLTPEEQAFVLGAEETKQEDFQPSEWEVFIEKYGREGLTALKTASNLLLRSLKGLKVKRT